MRSYSETSQFFAASSCRGIQRVDTGFLSQGNVVAEHVWVIDVDVEGARPCRVAEDGPELILIMGLRHENMKRPSPLLTVLEGPCRRRQPLPYEHASKRLLNP